MLLLNICSFFFLFISHLLPLFQFTPFPISLPKYAAPSTSILAYVSPTLAHSALPLHITITSPLSFRHSSFNVSQTFLLSITPPPSTGPTIHPPPPAYHILYSSSTSLMFPLLSSFPRRLPFFTFHR